MSDMASTYQEHVRECFVSLYRLNPKDMSDMSKIMEELLSTRRRSTPNVVKKLWNCIKTIRNQRQIPSAERITRHMAREHKLTEEQTLTQLSYCVEEGLIRRTQSSGCRGSKTGVEQEAYRLPKVELNRDMYDWYCWKCHKGGEVLKCTKCFRVYHTFCLTNFNNICNKFVCEVCYTIFNDESIISREELNRLLRYSCRRLIKILVVKKTPELTFPDIKNGSDFESDSESDGGQVIDLTNDDWQTNFLIFRYMDLKIMGSRLRENQYANLESFKADAEIYYHNTVILYGANSVEAESVLYMVEECKRDITEILLCKDCFRESNVRSSEDWFCLPCNPPHELVYAKQKGYCFWPAKVIKVRNDNYDVRFFGGLYSRAIVNKRNIRPISENIFKEVKRNVSWNKAYTELLKHQQYLLKKEDLGSNGDHVDPTPHIEEDLEPDLPLSTKREAPDLQCFSYNKKRVEEKKVPSPCGTEQENKVPSTCDKSIKQENRTSPKCQKKCKENNSTCTSIGNSISSMPSLQCRRIPELLSNGRRKDGSASDYSPLSWKRKKKCKSFQMSRSGFNVKDFGFDPNALQEEMGKFISEDVGEVSRSEGVTPAPSGSSLDWDMQENERLEELVTLSNGETSGINSAIEKLNKIIEDKKNQEIKFLKIKHARELSRCERDIKKLKRTLKNERSRHQEEIIEIKKHVWCQECFKKATYYCCYNTSYCSIVCQKNHWHIHHRSCQH